MMDGGEGGEVVYVEMDVQEGMEIQVDDEDEGVEVIEVLMDEALADLEFADLLDVLQPDIDEEVSKYILFVQDQNKI